MWLTISSQLKKLIPIFLVIYVPTFLILLTLLIWCNHSGTHISIFTRDPVSIMKAHPLIGLLSNFGILLWCSSTAICFFTYFIIRGSGTVRGEIYFFLFFGFLTLILLLDDFLLLHDAILPYYMELDEKNVIISYIFLLSLGLILFRNFILKTNFVLFLFALGFFAVSILVDYFIKDWLMRPIITEDGAKLFGIVSWFGYFAVTCFQTIKSSIDCQSRSKIIKR